jgi:hypothetical protein
VKVDQGKGRRDLGARGQPADGLLVHVDPQASEGRDPLAGKRFCRAAARMLSIISAADSFTSSQTLPASSGLAI